MYIESLRSLNGKRAALAEAIAEAQRIHKSERVPEREKQEQFDRVMKDVTRLKSECQALEIECERYNSPVPALEGYGGEHARDRVVEAHSRAFDMFLRRGQQAAIQHLRDEGAPHEVHALVEGQDDLGGFVAPDDIRSEVLRMVGGLARVGAGTSSAWSRGQLLSGVPDLHYQPQQRKRGFQCVFTRPR